MSAVAVEKVGSSNFSLMIAPSGCSADSAWTYHGYLLIFGSLYGILLSVVCTFLISKLYRKWELYDVAKVQIQRFGTLWVISTYFLALGIYLAGGVVNCQLGCSTYATECSSISCTVANHVPEGYAILALLLLCVCVSMLRSVNDLTSMRLEDAQADEKLYGYGGGRFGAAGEWIIRIGVVLTVITGLVPFNTSNCGVQPEAVTAVTGDVCFNKVMGGFHVAGIVGGLVLAIVGTTMRLFAPRLVKGKWKSFTITKEMPFVAALIVISLIFLLLVGLVFLVVYVTNEGDGMARQIDFCSRYTSKAGCDGQELPRLWQTWANERQMNSTKGLTRDGWQCEWLEDVAMTSSPCVRANCDHNGRLGSRKLAIVAEFLGLVNGIYGIYFAIWTISVVDKIIPMLDSKENDV